MRKTLFILFISLTCLAAATIKDPRQHVKLSPELSQQVVAGQQATQHSQSQVGGVPEKTDDTGYVQRSSSDEDASALVASHDPSATEKANDVFHQSNDARDQEAQKPRKAVFGAFWALLAGLLLAFAAWAGLSKYGPKPPGG